MASAGRLMPQQLLWSRNISKAFTTFLAAHIASKLRQSQTPFSPFRDVQHTFSISLHFYIYV